MIHQHGVLKSSVTGVRVGLHPSKGGKRGWGSPVWGTGNPGRKKAAGGKQVKEGYPAGLLHDVEFPCSGNSFCSALYLELTIDCVDVPLHGTHSNHEPVRNFTIGVARNNQP